MAIRIEVKFFALGKELVGRESLTYDLENTQTVGELLERIRADHAEFAKLPGFLTAVNAEYCEPSRELRDGDVLAIIPPVSGG